MLKYISTSDDDKKNQDNNVKVLWKLLLLF